MLKNKKICVFLLKYVCLLFKSACFSSKNTTTNYSKRGTPYVYLFRFVTTIPIGPCRTQDPISMTSCTSFNTIYYRVCNSYPARVFTMIYYRVCKTHAFFNVILIYYRVCNTRLASALLAPPGLYFSVFNMIYYRVCKTHAFSSSV